MSMKKNGIEVYQNQVVFADCPCLRVMSDVWDWCPYGVIVKADGTYETVWADYGTNAVVDANPEQVKAYLDHVEADRQAKALKARKEKAMLELQTVRCGKTVEVVHGRKVPIGTVGIVFWMKDTQYGMKIGLGIGDEKDSHGRFLNVGWTYLTNIKTVITQDQIDAVNALT